MNLNSPGLLHRIKHLAEGMSKFNSIVLIDDDEITHYLTMKLLKKMEVCNRVMTFRNGRTALDYLSRNHDNPPAFPDLIFLDLNMPVMDGFAFITELQTLWPANKCKIIILSTFIRESDRESLKSFDILGFIIKPITRKKLTDLFRTVDK